MESTRTNWGTHSQGYWRGSTAGESPTILQMISNELRLRNYSPKTIKAYLSCIKDFIRYHAPRDPKTFSTDDIRQYLLACLEEKQCASSTLNQILNALRFLYCDIYKMPFVLKNLPRPKKERTLPDVLEYDEIKRLLNCVHNTKHKTILMLIYSAGLRVGEAVRLKIEDIDSTRKLIHIRSGKGKKDRYTLLSDVLLTQLRNYYKAYRPKEYLFEGAPGRSHISERSVQQVFERAVKAAGIRKKFRFIACAIVSQHIF